MKPEFQKVIRGWRNIEESQRKEHYNSIKICLFSPFLFGKSYVSEDWLDWMQLAGFLKSSKRLEIKCYEEPYFFALDILEKKFEALRTKMEAPIFFFSCLTVVDEIDALAHKPEDCIRIGKAESTFCDFLDSEGDTFEKKMAVLYTVKSYIEYVLDVVNHGKNRFKDSSPSPNIQRRVRYYFSPDSGSCRITEYAFYMDTELICSMSNMFH
ncbi:uncharacterized protein LOC117114941 [Anneissia japonica]|uniref:uncharacterized protein LOC117114941 n=1 Tax=Anneissia japonica TaxID=1529436 RepID=UPI001425A937|nr:uncharacterized protein LOC117114941 [Anneissia japonica]